MRRILRIYLPPPGPSANIDVQTPAASGTRHTRGNTNAASSEQLPAGGGHRLRATRLTGVRDRQRQAHPGHRRPAGRVGDGPCAEVRLSIRTIQQATYDALLKYEGDPVELKPWLATSWTVNDDATVWTFKLDPRAKFQNGDPVDAAAVKASFERTLKLNKGPAWMYTDFLKPENISAEDPQTLRFTLSRPYAAFLSLLPWWYVVNVKQAMANEHNGDYGQQWLTDHTAGSGPYRVKRVEPNSLYELEAWDGYWKGWPQPEKARLGGIIYRVITENSSRRALRAARSTSPAACRPRTWTSSNRSRA